MRIQDLFDRYLDAKGDDSIRTMYHMYDGAPHEPPRLPGGFGAVYVFQLSRTYDGGEVQSRRVLKVGKAGPKSNARFQYQHYSSTAAGSTLAKSLLTNTALWPFLGIETLSEATVKSWILGNTDRQHLYLDGDLYLEHATEFEKYVRGVVGPVFEG